MSTDASLASACASLWGPTGYWGRGAGRAQFFAPRPTRLGRPEPAGPGPGSTGTGCCYRGPVRKALPWFLRLK